MQAEMYERMLRDREATQAALIGMAQQLGGVQRAQQEATVDAYRTAADQARAMSERSMQAMAQVAGAAAKAPQQVIVDPRVPTPRQTRTVLGDSDEADGERDTAKGSVRLCGNPACGQPLDDGVRFCAACDTRTG